MFQCVSYYLVALQNSVQNRPKWCKSSCHEVVSESFATNALDPPHGTLTSFSVRFILFGCIWESLVVLQHNAKWANLEQKFVPQSRVGIFRSEHTRSTPLDSKLMFWFVLYYLDVCGTVWLPYKTQCKTGRTGAKVRAMKSCRNVSQRTHPIHPIGL
jgi:hypothetical protein